LFHGKKVAVVMPAYNAARTLEQTYREIPLDLVDEVIVTDDASGDETVEVAKRIGLRTLVHATNRGYGANQKTCYTEALRLDADIVIMLHPDYQYTPKLLPAMIGLIADGPFDVVLGSRVLGGDALAGGMPLYKYIANRFLTAIQNLLMGAKLSEYHTGYRAFSREVLETLPLLENSDDFVFDNQMLAQILLAGFNDQFPAFGPLRPRCAQNLFRRAPSPQATRADSLFRSQRGAPRSQHPTAEPRERTARDWMTSPSVLPSWIGKPRSPRVTGCRCLERRHGCHLRPLRSGPRSS